MPNKFAIYAYPRTGSYNLVSLLNSADDIVCHGEIFKERVIEVSKWHSQRMSGFTPEYRDQNPVEYIQTLRSLNPYRHFGFKFFRNHVHRVPHLNHILKSDSWKKIALIRDPIEVYASIRRANKTNVWIVNNNSGPEEKILNQSVSFTEESWDHHVKYYSSFLKSISNLNNYIVVNYKDYSTEGQLNKILSFIGSKSDPQGLRSGTKKQFSRVLEDGFDNWDEFQAYLKKVPAPKI